MQMLQQGPIPLIGKLNFRIYPLNFTEGGYSLTLSNVVIAKTKE